MIKVLITTAWVFTGVALHTMIVEFATVEEAEECIRRIEAGPKEVGFVQFAYRIS